MSLAINSMSASRKARPKTGWGIEVQPAGSSAVHLCNRTGDLDLCIGSRQLWRCVACFQEPRPEPIDACIGFAAVVDGCIAQSCPESGVISVGIRTAVTSLCSDVVRSETFTEAEVTASRDTNACDDDLTSFTDYMLNVNPMVMGSGLLVGLCAGIPQTTSRSVSGPALLCWNAYQNNPLREDGICEFFCMTNESDDAIESRTWACSLRQAVALQLMRVSTTRTIDGRKQPGDCRDTASLIALEGAKGQGPQIVVHQSQPHGCLNQGHRAW